MGDPEFGGSGWEVTLPDGTKEKYFVQLPPGLVTVDIFLSDLPEEVAKQWAGKTAADMGRYYLRYLRGLLIAAKKQFAE